MKMKTALTISSSNSSGGVGIQADLKTFMAHKLFGTSVVTSVVAENTIKVSHFYTVTTESISLQLNDVFTDTPPEAVKIGMLGNMYTIKAVADKLKQYKAKNIVLDPVMYTKNGDSRIEEMAIQTLITMLIPLADIITPNLVEVERLLDKKVTNLEKAAEELLELGCKAVVIKDIHKVGDDTVDLFYDGTKFDYFVKPRLKTKNLYGTGCTYSSSIAANLANGFSKHDAVDLAKKYVTQAIKTAPNLEHRYGFINHMIDVKRLY